MSECVVCLPRIKSFALRSFCNLSLSARRALSMASLTAFAFLISERSILGTAEMGCAAAMECAPGT